MVTGEPTTAAAAACRTLFRELPVAAALPDADRLAVEIHTEKVIGKYTKERNSSTTADRFKRRAR